MKLRLLPRFRFSVWILLIPALLVRLLLMMHYPPVFTTAAWSLHITALLFSLLLVICTWYCASVLARAAGLSEHGKERFMVMATLTASIPPLPAILTELGVPIGTAALLIDRIYSSPVLSLLFIGNLVITIIALFIALASCLMTIWWQQALLLRLRKLTGVPLLFCGCIVMISATLAYIHSTFSEYAIATFVLVLPFLPAALFTTPYMIAQYRREKALYEKNSTLSHSKAITVLHVCMLIVICLYFCGQLYIYFAAN
jgi:hypothetical protein